MHIKEIAIRNFRILLESRIELDKQPCLMMGRNNTGKTSFMVLLEKFLKGQHFDFNDFPLQHRAKLLGITDSTDVSVFSIQMMLTICYEQDDNLFNLSEFIVDLEGVRNEVYILFERRINKHSLIKAIGDTQGAEREKYIRRHIGDHMESHIYTFGDATAMCGDRKQMVEKSLGDVEKLIDFEIIHAKRNVASSEARKGGKVLSSLTTDYFNARNSADAAKFEAINKLIEDTDRCLDINYEKFFGKFMDTAKDFLGISTLAVRSNLKAKEILEDASVVVYGSEGSQLPEHQNGLGHMNILYLLLSIQICKRSFKENSKDIKLLFIEEPEAHTHPQLQYNFARKIKDLIGDDLGIQTLISTHSPHIVSSYPFENLRYMALETDEDGFNSIQIKHFHSDLYKKYRKEAEIAATKKSANNRKAKNLDPAKVEVEEFQFLKQYLTIVSSELFFADKAIFIEGTSEALLLPYFIAQFDAAKQKGFDDKKDEEGKKNYVPLAAQNIAIVEAGANAKVFRHFVEFLGIPALIITDIDTVRQKVERKGKKKDGTDATKTTYPECKVSDDEACNTSNATIKYYLDEPDEILSATHDEWFKKMLEHKLIPSSNRIHLSYQCREKDDEKSFYPRSFEDAFINVNLQMILDHWSSDNGLKNKKYLSAYVSKKAHENDGDRNEYEKAKKTLAQKKIEDIYDLTETILDGKSGFASNLLYLSYAKGVEWETPKYIKEGLEWLQEQKH